MLAAIGSILGIVINGVLSPLFAFLGKKSDASVSKEQIDRTADSTDLQTEAGSVAASNQAKAAASGWWGWHVMVMAFGLPAALHWGALFWVSTFPWLGWTVQAVPATYANAEITIALSFFVLTLFGKK